MTTNVAVEISLDIISKNPDPDKDKDIQDIQDILDTLNDISEPHKKLDYNPPNAVGYPDYNPPNAVGYPDYNPHKKQDIWNIWSDYLLNINRISNEYEIEDMYLPYNPNASFDIIYKEDMYLPYNPNASFDIIYKEEPRLVFPPLPAPEPLLKKKTFYKLLKEKEYMKMVKMRLIKTNKF